MDRLPSVEPLTPQERAALLGVARSAVAETVRNGLPLRIEPLAHPPRLAAPAASFVTLRHGGVLRGCTGRLAPVAPLVADVARSAHRAACEDPRFAPVAASELPGLEVKISVLSALQPLPAGSRVALLATLRPGVDGLVLRESRRGATFLPAVWESLNDPARFLAALLQKAGLPADHWSESLRFERFVSEEIG